ncbi:PoNe immunity protein domain-containing protein [Pelistega ratti]|uniref:PoNe immunity protein domain-containing protein n=1 Tax=Pelistega ratti TaxID=2652177 RepID=UPI0013593239|nr:PoNe immunity protein domain-containing protein [Pelistega ratti]
MNNVEQKKRSVFLKPECYQKIVEFYNKHYKYRNIFSITPPKYIQERGAEDINYYYKGLSWDLSSHKMEYMQIQYSAGIDMNEIAEETKSMLACFKQHFSQDFPREKLYLWEADSYIYILWLLSLAVLSDSPEYLQIIPTWIGSENEHTDLPFVDKPMKAFLDLVGYQGQVQVEEKALFPKSVYPLIPEIIEADAHKKGELLKKYLKGWYKSNKDTYWYDYHRSNKGKLFFGYWSFESAVLALLLNIDVSIEEINQMSVFPKDYFDWSNTAGRIRTLCA